MLTQQNFDAVAASSYLENYLDCLDSLPDNVQRHISEIRRLDAQYYDGINKIQELRREFLQICHPPIAVISPDSPTSTSATIIGEQKRTILQRVKYLLAQGQIISDEKLKQIASMLELLEHKWRSLDQDGKTLDFDCSEGLLKPQSNSIVSRSSPMHPSKILDHDAIGINVNLVLRSERRQAIEDSESPTIVVSTTSSFSTRQGSNSNNHKRARRQKQFPDFVRETDVGLTSEPQTLRRDRTSAIVSTGSATPTTTAAATTPTTTATTTVTVNTASSSASAQSRRRRKLNTGSANSAGSSGAGSNGGGSASGSNKSAKFNVPVDPDEPTYCLCEQVSYGEMIGCDNVDCEIEWFHFNCVSLTVKPKGKWFCPNCRGERSNVMKE